MTETLTFQQGKSYIVKNRINNEWELKVLVLGDTYIQVAWLGVKLKLPGQKTLGTYDLQKFKYEYSIVEEVG